MRWLLGVRKKWLAWLHDRSGVAAAITAVTMAVLLGFAALVIDMGHIMVARGELQNAADAAALAGARGYFPNSPPPGPLTPDCASAKAAATDYVSKNYADTQGLTVDPGDIKTGLWTWGSPGSFTEKTDFTGFTPSSGTVLAIQVTVKKDSSYNNPVAMTLAAIFGLTDADVHTQAVAVNELPLGTNQSCETFVFAVPECLANSACDASNKKYTVRFSNDPNDTAGWASFVNNPNANDLMCLSESIGVPCGTTLKGGCKSSSFCQPPEEVKGCPGGTPVYVQNGVDNSVIQALADTLKAWWETCGKPLTLRVPVIQGGAGTDCTGVKWTGTKCLMGYSDFVIDPSAGGYVNPTSNNTKWYPLGNPGNANEIKGYVSCPGDHGSGKPGPAGTNFYGTVSLVPKLVK